MTNKKMNGRYQVGSGRIVTFTHDTPFIEDIVSHSKDEFNDKTVNNDDLRYSTKNTESVYDLMRENKRLAEEKEKD